MLRELISIIRAVNPLREVSEDFAEMLRITRQQVLDAGHAFFEINGAHDPCERIRSEDKRVNSLQVAIRRKVTDYLSSEGSNADLPYCLLLVSLVKDVERLGDYAKNLCELRQLHSGDLPEDELVGELLEIRRGVERSFALLATVFDECDREQAVDLLMRGQEFARRCDVLVSRVAGGTYKPSVAAVVLIGARHYKRIGGHVLNVLSSVVMPLHKVDYYDEDTVSSTHDA